jgi:peptide/nickel transport system permease protein
MVNFIIKRLISMVFVLAGIVFVIYLLLYLSPGCPAMISFGLAVSPERLLSRQYEWGLLDPFIVQYGRFMRGLILYQDLGTSLRGNIPVRDLIVARLPFTIRLAVSGMLIAIIIGIPVGIIAAVKPNSIFATVTTVSTVIAFSIPQFIIAAVMEVLFADWWRSLVVGTWQYMLIPSIAVGVGVAAGIARMTRSSMLDVMNKEYIRTCRAKGQKEIKVVMDHAFKNALIPIVTVIGFQFGILLGGVILTEFIFRIPGIGSLMLNSLWTRDFPIVLGVALVISLMFSVVNLLVDISYAFIDPRIRNQYK